MKILAGLCLAISIVFAGANMCEASEAGAVYSSDILATINGISVPSYSIGGKTAIVIEDLMHYGSTVIFDSSSRILYTDLLFRGTSINVFTMERGRSGDVVGYVNTTDIQTHFKFRDSGYIAVPGYSIDGKMCVAIEDLGSMIPGISYYWDGVGRTIELRIENHNWEIVGGIIQFREQDTVPDQYGLTREQADKLLYDTIIMRWGTNGKPAQILLDISYVDYQENAGRAMHVFAVSAAGDTRTLYPSGYMGVSVDGAIYEKSHSGLWAVIDTEDSSNRADFPITNHERNRLIYYELSKTDTNGNIWNYSVVNVNSGTYYLLVTDTGRGYEKVYPMEGGSAFLFDDDFIYFALSGGIPGDMSLVKLPYFVNDDIMDEHVILYLSRKGRVGFLTPLLVDEVFYFIKSNPSPTGAVATYTVMSASIHDEMEHKGEMAIFYGEHSLKTRDIFITDAVPYHNMTLSHAQGGYLYYRLTPNWAATDNTLEGLYRINLIHGGQPEKVE